MYLNVALCITGRNKSDKHTVLFGAKSNYLFIFIYLFIVYSFCRLPQFEIPQSEMQSNK